MAYTRILLDDFNDGVINAAQWPVTQGPGAYESDGTLNLPCTSDYPQVQANKFFDLSEGIFAARLFTSGTRVDATEFYIGAHDGSGNIISALSAPNGTYLTFSPFGATTFTNEVVTDTSVGIGPSWTEGKWWGIGNMTADNVVRMYNSFDGQTWNEMSRCVVGGTFDKSNTSMMLMAGIWNATSTDLTARFDNASFWQRTEDISRVVRVRRGGSWVDATPKVMDGGSWESSTPRTYDGSMWRTAK